MFDVAFSELVIIAVVALIVIGPERLPKVARTAGHLLGRLQRYVSDVKADINREMQLEELKKFQSDITTQASGIERSINEQMKSVETDLNQSIDPAAVAKPADEVLPASANPHTYLPPLEQASTTTPAEKPPA